MKGLVKQKRKELSVLPELEKNLKHKSSLVTNLYWCYYYEMLLKPFHPQVFFNEVPVECSVFQKQLALYLDQKLDFSKHVNEKSLKHKKEYQSLKNFSILPKKALLTIHKS